MSEAPALLYLEADDEITAVVRRLRAAEPGRVVIVAPGRSRATSSAVALRLLARAADEDGRELSVVGDLLTRSLAAEAGIASYASIDEARRAEPAVPDAAPVPRHAAIQVVRGAATGDTAPTLAAMPPAVAAETRPVPIVRPASPRAAARARERRRLAPLPLLAALGLLLLATGVVAASVLPAATIRLVPRTQALGPFMYDITVGGPRRISGTVEETATVNATGTYPIQAAATGSVVLYNWTFRPVRVPAGTFVAAGEQAFATRSEVVVPRGRLTADGRIGAGDVTVAVTAAAVGPAANVEPHAIDTIVDQEVDQQLRGFPENPERRVDNLEATSGGLDETGVEITQADVDTAVTALREALQAAATAELEATGDALFADLAEPPQPVIDRVEELPGTRDQETVDIHGSLAYDRLSVDRDEVVERALEQFAEDSDVLPEGHELLPDATSVSIGEVRREGDGLVVSTTVRARSSPAIDPAEVLGRVVGLSESEARAALADLGEASVELWPGWVAEVPDADWRIDLRIESAETIGPEPSGS